MSTITSDDPTPPTDHNYEADGISVWFTSEEETHLCLDCGKPCSVEEPLCWNCECGDSTAQ